MTASNPECLISGLEAQSGTITAYPSLPTFSVQQRDGSSLPVSPSISLAVSAGSPWTIALPAVEDCSPAVTWTIKRTDGSTYNGVITRAMAQASLTQAITPYALEYVYGWTVATSISASALPTGQGSYFLYKSLVNGLYYAVNRKTGAADYNGSDFTTIVNQALSNLATNASYNQQGGSVIVAPDRHIIMSDVIVPAMTTRGATAGLALLAVPGSRYNTELYVASNAVLTSAAIQIGSDTVAEAKSSYLQGFTLSFDPNYKTTTTGKVDADGILVMGTRIKLLDIDIEYAPGHGVHYRSATGNATTNYDCVAEDVYVVNPGNAVTVSGYTANTYAGVYVETTVGDSEFERCKVQGDQSAHAYPSYGFWNKGDSVRYHNCHPFYCNSDGFHMDASDTTHGAGRSMACTISEGESETNNGCGVYLNKVDQCNVNAVEMYSNTGAADIYLTFANRCGIQNNKLRSTAGPSIVVGSSCNDNSLHGNHCHTTSTYGISVQGGSSLAQSNSLMGNVVDQAATTAIRVQDAAHSALVGNVTNKAIVESSSAGTSDYNIFSANQTNGGGVTTVGTHSVSANNL